MKILVRQLLLFASVCVRERERELGLGRIDIFLIRYYLLYVFLHIPLVVLVVKEIIIIIIMYGRQLGMYTVLIITFFLSVVMAVATTMCTHFLVYRI